MPLISKPSHGSFHVARQCGPAHYGSAILYVPNRVASDRALIALAFASESTFSIWPLLFFVSSVSHSHCVSTVSSSCASL